MERAEFERLVKDGFVHLPEHVREKIRNVALLVEDEPSEEIRKAEGLGPDETLLGLYRGVPLSARGYEHSLTLPDTITLYRLPIERVAGEDGADVRDVIADTIWHEFAHHFGMDEDEVRERETRRNIRPKARNVREKEIDPSRRGGRTGGAR